MSTAAESFLARPNALTETAGTLTDRATDLSTVYGQLSGPALPTSVFGTLPASGLLHTAYTGALEAAGTRVRDGGQSLGRLATGLRGSATNYRTGDEDAATAYRSLLGTEGAGAGDGPFADRIADNRRKVGDALTAERARLDQLRAQETEHEQRSWFGRMFDGDGDVADEITGSQHRIALYESIVDNNRKVLDFDPTGDGRIVELVGDIDENTRNVGVLVPGTFANLDNYDGLYERAKGFVDADPNGSLAMVTWQNGDFPPSLPQAASASYSADLSPRLADFSHQLREQIDSSAAAGNDVQVTVAGHSYGGAVVGLAEHDGLDANRVLHIESAGMGHEVWSADDIHNVQPDVQRYSMTAPGDPIGYTQGTEVGNLGHGADPDTFPGTTDLATGDYPDGTELHGTSAHSDVFTYHSDAWWNMYGVFTGGSVTPAGDSFR